MIGQTKPLAIGESAYVRGGADLPSAEVFNYYVEPAPSAPEGRVWIPRPGLVTFRVGDGDLRGLFRLDGCLGGDVVAVIGNTVWRIPETGSATSLGTVGGVGRVSIAGSLAGVMITDGVNGWYSTGGAIAALTLPFSNPSAVIYGSGYWQILAGGTQRRYRATDIAPTVWDALAFDSASESPDPLVTIAFSGGRVWDIGTRTIEMRYATGDAEAPFAPETGRSYQRGCKARDSLSLIDNTIVWVGDDNIVYRGGDVPQAISGPFLSEKIAATDPGSIYAHSLAWQGHVFYCLTLENQGTWLYDFTTQQWCQWGTYDKPRWSAGMVCDGWDNLPLVGDVETGTLYRLDADVFADAGVQLIGKLTAGAPVRGDRVSVARVRLEVTTGTMAQVPLAADPDPLVGMEISRDGGNSWGPMQYRSMGQAGEHYRRVVWNRLGQFRLPGVLLRFTVSDPVPRRVTGAFLDGAF
jgi:hypothetical protein